MAAQPVERALTLLTPSSLNQAVAGLGAADPRLAALVDANGIPPIWNRAESFATLVQIILEQQVSLDSAAAAFRNLAAAIGDVTPDAFLQLDTPTLRGIGFSRQKTEYCRGIAQTVLDGDLDLAQLRTLPDGEVREVLTSLRGIGPWTAEVYLVFALLRFDVWPTGDRALVVSMAESLPLPEVPDYDAAREVAETWRPWRSVAARILWHSYLLRRGRSIGLS